GCRLRAILSWPHFQPFQPVPEVRALATNRVESHVSGGKCAKDGLLVPLDKFLDALRRSGDRRVVYFFGRSKTLANIPKSLAKLWSSDCLGERFAVTKQ